MSHNFSLTTLINLLQVELDWYAVHFHSLEKTAKKLVDDSITGKLMLNDLSRIIADVSFLYGIKRLEPRQIHRLTAYLQPGGHNGARFNYIPGPIQSLDGVFYDRQPNRDLMTGQVITAILNDSDYTLLGDIYSFIKSGQPDVPWSGEYEKYDRLVAILRAARVRYPSGFQALTKVPRLTDELSTEVYRQFDEIIGALEKINSDKQWTSSSYDTHNLMESYTFRGGDKNPQLSHVVRKAIDGEPNPGCGFDEDDDGVFDAPVYNPETVLVKKLDDEGNLQAIVKAIASAVHTRNDNGYPQKYALAPSLATVNPGYFDGLTRDHLKQIYADDINEVNLHRILRGVKYYSLQGCTTGIDGDGRVEDRQFNPVLDHRDHEGNLRLPINRGSMPVEMNTVVDFDVIAKSPQTYRTGPSYLACLIDIVFFAFGNGNIWRRKVSRIKSVPLRHVWELPLIVNPHKTIEEIFADLGYELLEKSEPNAKPEPAVRKPAGKRK
ncbi:hypothetical protein AH06_324 [Erwinia phage AH06]|nr:hypothetical protein AH06_324 [Erwinia phage AH06]